MKTLPLLDNDEDDCCTRSLVMPVTKVMQAGM